jgi:hypothetical protein
VAAWELRGLTVGFAGTLEVAGRLVAGAELVAGRRATATIEVRRAGLLADLASDGVVVGSESLVD